MNEDLHARLRERLQPGHQCSPYSGACQLPHYINNYTAPNHVVRWPEYSVARQKADELRELRDWGDEEDA